MPTYTLRNHRIGAAVAVGLSLAGGIGAGAATASSFADESIQQYQIDATLEGDTLSVVETIDYDFGLESRRGIFRELDLGVSGQAETLQLANVTASTATANGELQIGRKDSRTALLRVGNPDETFTREHRYQLGYDLVGVPDPAVSGQFTFMAIGDRWEVPIKDVTVRVATDFEAGELRCAIVGQRSFDDCDISASDGVVTANVDKLSEGQGVELQIGAAQSRAPATLQEPPPALGSTGSNPMNTVVLIGVATALAGVTGALLAGRWVRRVGADRSGAVGNPSEAAYAGLRIGQRGARGKNVPDGTPISDADAAKEVTMQFAPPEGLTPPQGAVLLRERADDGAKTAWLAEAVIDGWVALDGEAKSPTITHTERSDRDPSHMPAPLAAIFNGRREVELGQYDKDFAAGWEAIGGKLKAWKRSSGLWDEDARKQNERKVALLLVAAVVAGLGALASFASGLGRVPLLAVPVAVTSGLLLGAGLRAGIGIPTLKVRNPAGYGLWLRTEGFRRFLAETEGAHARRAADQGMLLEYSAWAVALGELDRWNRAAAAAGIPPTDRSLATTASFVALSSKVKTTSTQPKSSSGGSGGGSSGSVGGGGGGSW